MDVDLGPVIRQYPAQVLCEFECDRPADVIAGLRLDPTSSDDKLT
jgi:hypothetical protein